MKIAALVFGLSFSLFGSGLHLAVNPVYYARAVVTDQDSAGTEHTYNFKGLAYEGEIGYSFDLIFFRIIPILALSQASLSTQSSDEPSSLTINPADNYKMGRFGYGLRIDLFGALYVKGGGAVYSLTKDPQPADNFHINGNGTFYEGGFAFNFIPFVSLAAGVRYESVTYKKKFTNTLEDSLDKDVKQTNYAGVLSLGIRF